MAGSTRTVVGRLGADEQGWQGLAKSSPAKANVSLGNRPRALRCRLVVRWKGWIGALDEVTLGEAAELLARSPHLLTDVVQSGSIPARTTDAEVRISRADIDLFCRRIAPPSRDRTSVHQCEPGNRSYESMVQAGHVASGTRVGRSLDWQHGAHRRAVEAGFRLLEAGSA